MRLPEHIEPMLAVRGEPFDSDEHLFELKWDGIRAIAYVGDGQLRMHGRRRRDLATRYPELGLLADLPVGTVLDGELVVLAEDGRPDFRAVLSRENAGAGRVAAAARQHPVVYVVFDLLYERGEALLEQPLDERRRRLERLVEAASAPRVMLSESVVGDGLALFEAASERELEGVVAKRRDSRYLPGERTDAWQKVKPVKSIHCLVLGYEPDPVRDGEFKSLIVATDLDGELRCVGKVGSGIGESQRTQLRELLRLHAAEQPLIDVDVDGCWLRPGIYCMVSYLERTASGNLRAPVFKGLVMGGSR